MFKRFTERARRVIILAREEAELYRHEYLGTEHILQGVIKDGGGIAVAILQKSAVDLAQLKKELEKSLPRSSNSLIIGDIPFTSRAKKVLEFAVEEARSVNHNYIGTEHLLLGLLKEKEGVACRVLNSFGMYFEDVKEKILEIKKKLADNLPSIPSLLGDELKCNIFLKAKDLKSFSKLRDLKDNF